ncbi:MAG: glucosyltransferase domain-containing protein [Flavobacteriaceae bacterium]|nr:glucosyltransferase domain-containing protein [Flavobacteriaceae bacterium]
MNFSAKEIKFYSLILFAFFASIIVYGFSLTNFSLMVDSESPIYPHYSLEHGRLGTNLIRYHIFGGLWPYFTQLLGLFFLSYSAVIMTKLFRFTGLWQILFILLFISFPQHAYQLAFTMQADAIGIGYFTGALAVYVFIRYLEGLELKSWIRFTNIWIVFVVFLLIAFTISIYQALIYVPVMLYAAYFFKNLFEEFRIKEELIRLFSFIGLVIFGFLGYLLMVKIWVPAGEGQYLSSYASGSLENQWLTFWKVFKSQILGKFYYGNQLNIIVLLSSVILFVYIIFKRKWFIFKLFVLIFLVVTPYAISYFITNNSHPPRIFIGSSIIFGFLPVFVLKKFLHNKIVLWLGILVFFINTFYITQLFVAAHRIYTHDLMMARQLDQDIKQVIGKYKPNSTYVYLHGAPSSVPYQSMKIPNSEIFSSSIFQWDRGSNWRMLNFFRYHDLGDYKYVSSEENFDKIKDSISRMPLWPNPGSIVISDNVVAVKLAERAGARLPFQSEIKEEASVITSILELPEQNKKIVGNFDEFREGNNSVEIIGWSALQGVSSNDSETFLIIFNAENRFIKKTKSYKREDITKWLNDGNDYDFSGFVCNFDKDSLPVGEYELGILIVDNQNENTFYNPFGKSILIK